MRYWNVAVERFGQLVVAGETAEEAIASLLEHGDPSAINWESERSALESAEVIEECGPNGEMIDCERPTQQDTEDTSSVLDTEYTVFWKSENGAPVLRCIRKDAVISYYRVEMWEKAEELLKQENDKGIKALVEYVSDNGLLFDYCPDRKRPLQVFCSDGTGTEALLCWLRSILKENGYNAASELFSML